MSVEDTVRSMWKALSARDFEMAKTYLADDCIYYDVPIGPAAAARGPEGIVARLRLGLEDLAAYTNFPGRMVGEGDTVMYEHSERWTWPTGETVVLPFVTVHTVRAGKVTLWADYWNSTTLSEAAPPGWQESLATKDMSWAFDATGLV